MTITNILSSIPLVYILIAIAFIIQNYFYLIGVWSSGLWHYYLQCRAEKDTYYVAEYSIDIEIQNKMLSFNLKKVLYSHSMTFFVRRNRNKTQFFNWKLFFCVHVRIFFRYIIENVKWKFCFLVIDLQNFLYWLCS